MKLGGGTSKSQFRTGWAIQAQGWLLRNSGQDEVGRNKLVMFHRGQEDITDIKKETQRRRTFESCQPVWKRN